jgi:hypothetical protein
MTKHIQNFCLKTYLAKKTELWLACTFLPQGSKLRNLLNLFVYSAMLFVSSTNISSFSSFFVYFFGGLECVGHSFAYVAHL